MPRARNPKRDEALKLWLESKKERTLVDIARELGIADSLVRKWKCEDHWEQARLRKIGGETVVIVTNKKGAPKGNKNAVGAGAPKGNDNALKTGEFERLFFDSLDNDEQQLIRNVTLDKKNAILHELQLLTVRERRMLKLLELYKGRVNQTAEIRTSIQLSDEITQTVKAKPIAEYILNIEDGLTRIQSQKRQYLDLLYKIDKSELEVF